MPERAEAFELKKELMQPAVTGFETRRSDNYLVKDIEFNTFHLPFTIFLISTSKSVNNSIIGFFPGLTL